VHTPTLLQNDFVECGAASLSIILRYYQRYEPLVQIREACHVSRDGSKASHIVAAAEHYGLDAGGYQQEVEDLKTLDCPAILYWQFNHFLVLEGYHPKKDIFYLNDPAMGHRQVSFRQMAESFTGIVLCMEPGDNFEQGGIPDTPVLWRVYHRLKKVYKPLLYCLIASLLLLVPSFMMPSFSRLFVDQILIEQKQYWLWPVLGLMFFLLSAQTLVQYGRLWILRSLQGHLSMYWSMQFVWTLLRLPVSFYAQRFSGEISSRTQLNEDVVKRLCGPLVETFIDILMLFFYVVIMFKLNITLTLVCVGCGLINVLGLRLMMQHREDATMALAQDYGKVSGVAMAGIQSIETLKASGLESDFFARFCGYYIKALQNSQFLEVKNQTLATLPVLIESFMNVLVLCLGAYWVTQGALSMGTLVAFQLLMLQFLSPLKRLLDFMPSFQSLSADLLRLDDILHQSTDPLLLQSPQDVSKNIHNKDKLKGDIQLVNLSFSFSAVTAPLIHDFNLTIRAGQTVALVGGSGSGKSTIAKLIAGIYCPQSGQILFDGQPRAHIPSCVMHASLGMVEQDITLLEGRIWDNLSLFDETISEAQILKACQDAEILDVVKSLPGGLLAHLGENGLGLSGGQKQRLEIARALTPEPRILIMDEATSALDNITETRINANIKTRGCTCIVVAHRLSSIQDCDEIIVLHQGAVVQRGTHIELLSSGGYYADLVREEQTQASDVIDG